MTDSTLYDLVVMGAGIQGAGVAYLAAKQGLKVCVIERNAEAGLETSSASSKLIHGGLRYLETAQFKLVYECLNEQRHLLNQFPNLVHRKPFYIPVYANSKRAAWWIYLGLWLYYWLAGRPKEYPIRKIPKALWPVLGLNLTHLKAVYSYSDAQTDDVALTQKVLDLAVRQGADVYFESVVQSCSFEQNYNLLLNQDRVIRTKALVNAAGPWVNEVAAVLNMPQHPVDWVQGTHIVLPVSKINDCYSLEAQDGRAVFVLPWRHQTLVGTTETPIQSPKAQATDAEIEYLLDVFNHYFPNLRQLKTDITQVMCGVRVLPKSELSAHQRSRDTFLLHVNAPPYVAIYGGKLTAFRATAQKVLGLLAWRQ
jgi:glycerol-3-phosphate dehydrogenase